MNHAPDAYTRLPHTFGRVAWLFQVPDFQPGITENPGVKAASAQEEKTSEKSEIRDGE